MKPFYQFLSCFLIVTAFSLTAAATDKGNIKITGTVVDSLTKKPVEFANIALMKQGSSTPIDGAVADAEGRFTISRVAAGDYQVAITFIGFETKTISVTVDKKDIDLGRIIISPTQKLLEAVTVEGQRALIEERVDRTIYNAENDATARGGDATDVLKRVPLLSVDLDGNVSLRGNSNLLVLINNKPSTIMASNVGDALKQIPADQIKSVEVITSPSAKYDAEGSAGIINIITKKNTLEGLTLNVDTGIGLRGSNLGLNGNYRRGKMGFALGGFGRAMYNIEGNFTNQQLTGTTLNIQKADTRMQGLFGNYNLGWDYDIDKKNTLAASVRFGVRNGHNFQDGLTTERYDNDALVRSSIADVESKNENNNIDASFTYTHYYEKPQRELSFQGNYSRNNGNNDFENIYREWTGYTSDPLDRLNKNESYNQEITFQGDYQTPISTNQMLEFGGKNILRKVQSDFQTFEAGADGIYLPSAGAEYNNNLNYDQNVTAGYLSYTYSTNSGYSFKAGSRYEYTTINAYSKTDDDIEIPSYGVVVPSINASKKLKNGNTLKASYNRRIQRPSIRFLNPNIQWQNNLSITQGNPSLDPEYTNNYELSYSTLIKGVMLNMSTFARLTDGEIESVRDVVEIDGNTVNRTTYQNIGKEQAYGVNFFANINIGKLSLNGGGDIFYNMLENPSIGASNEGWVMGGRMFGNYNLNKGWGLQGFGFYRGRRVDLQGIQGGFYMYSIAIRKEFNEKRGSVGLGLENFLQRAMKVKNEVSVYATDGTPILVQKSLDERFNTSIRLNFSYRIGKMSVDGGRRSRRSINNDDLKEGGDNSGMDIGGGGQQQPQRNGGGVMGGGQRQQTRPQGQVPGGSAQQTVANDSVTYDAAGTWNYTIDSPQGGGGIIVIKNENGAYTGTIKTARMPQETNLTDVVVKGNEVSFSYPVNFGGNSNTVTVKYIVNKDSIAGTMNIGNMRSFNLTGTRGQ